MQIAIRLVATTVLTALILFCTFGFLATYEPLDPSVQITWRVIYGGAALAAAVGIIRINRRRQPGLRTAGSS